MDNILKKYNDNKNEEVDKSDIGMSKKINHSAEVKSNKTNHILQSKTKKITQKVTSQLKENKKKSQSKIENRKEHSQQKTIKNVNKVDITEFNAYLFHQGKNYEAYNMLGSHIKTIKRKKGVQFSTWAPKAQCVYVVGDFNNFAIDDNYRLDRITENGLWSGFFPEIKTEAKYKYCILDENNNIGEYKSDPYALLHEVRPNTASIVYENKKYKWTDKKWINKRNSTNFLEEPINIYEMHLGSWRRNENGEFMTYEEISSVLPEYLKDMHYTHVEFMPISEHPFDGSWGYQCTGYYSPTSRYGGISSFKLLIDKLHKQNIGVILDWAPGHFCKDAHGLYKFDGHATYEYNDVSRAENKGWGTCNFDLGKPEVRSYLISNALYWYREFHIDGLRVDAVSSILYLDYNRNLGEWIPNKYGGNENLEAIEFLQELNKAVFVEYPSALMIAEESTAWPNVTKPSECKGLGFNFKWNMGWMNDTLEYIEIDPKYRSNKHKNITFPMMYNYAENYILPISHDEVVHEKKPLINKMWGDQWNKFAGLRAFAGYMIGHPGKKLIFMGCEFAQAIEWREYEELQWNIIDESVINKQTQDFFKDLNKIYYENKALWQLDYNENGFSWIEPDNNSQSILIFQRKSKKESETLIFIINFTPKVYYDYQIGVPYLGEYEELFNTDRSKYGGSGQIMGTKLIAENIKFHNQPYSLKIKVPPMATLVLKIDKIEKQRVCNLTIKED